MILAEGLFGRVRIPDWARDIALAPEVQRLREVRLINTSTPYLPALSDARRFTHTIGVTFLASSAAPRLRKEFTMVEIRSLVAAALVHDVGSPPFGHLFEYLLKARSGWTHEAALAGILEGDYRPDNIYHQIYYGKALSLRRAFERADVDPELVARLVLGADRLGPLIAGSIDFDNIDNVFRMTSLLGLSPNVAAARQLSEALVVEDGSLVIDSSGIEALQTWRALRRQAYEILAFDPNALAGQAMLTDAISRAMESGVVSSEQWFWTDEELLRQLCSPQQPKYIRDPAQRFVVGDFYTCLGIYWYNGCDTNGADLRLPEHRELMGEQLSTALGVPCSVYVFYDKGTFEKELRLRIRESPSDTREERTVGRTSSSTIIGVFTPRRKAPKLSRSRTKVVEVFEGRGLCANGLLPILTTRGEQFDVHRQAQLPL